MSAPPIEIGPFDDAELSELVRMLAARKAAPAEDGETASMSLFLNAFLLACLGMHPDAVRAAAPFAAGIRRGFLREVRPDWGDGAMARYLAARPSDAARLEELRLLFLPLQAPGTVSLSSPEGIARSFEAAPHPPLPASPFAHVHPPAPRERTVAVARPFVPLIYGQVLAGRHGTAHLELRRTGGTDAAASDRALACLREAAREAQGGDGPFLAPTLRWSDFAASPAYANMMALGFSREEMLDALAPWELVDG